MKKVLIFTGAGMSVPLGLPSTVDFMDKINNGAAPVTQNIIRHLDTISHGNDIEWILSSLEDLHKSKSFFEVNLSNLISGGAALTGHQPAFVAHTLSNLNNLKYQTLSELVRIKKIIFDMLKNYETEKAQSMYFNLFDEIKKIQDDISFSFFTANYDLTFESAFDQNESAWEQIGIKNIDYGFKEKRSRLIYQKGQ